MHGSVVHVPHLRRFPLRLARLSTGLPSSSSFFTASALTSTRLTNKERINAASVTNAAIRKEYWIPRSKACCAMQRWYSRSMSRINTGHELLCAGCRAAVHDRDEDRRTERAGHLLHGVVDRCAVRIQAGGQLVQTVGHNRHHHHRHAEHADRVDHHDISTEDSRFNCDSI